MIEVTKVWWDGEKIMTEPVGPAVIYKEPEQPAQRKPLTDAQIEQIFKESAGYGGNDFISFARAIEAKLKENT